MVYDWEPHKDVLHQFYIQERKSLEDIMQHMRENYAFSPSKRAYQTQFKRWQFPSKQNPAHRDVDLVARVKQLWEQNYSQRRMLTTLNQEGYGIKERELMRVRAKNRWLLRVPNGAKSTAEQLETRLQEVASGTFMGIEDGSSPHPQSSNAPVSTAAINGIATSPMPADSSRKRKERRDQLQAESDELWAAKKRRRRTRGYAGLAADPPGPPRFPSETTLDESKQFLSLDTESYRQVRDHFQTICEESGVIKKTLAGADKWQAVKDRLVQENTLLQAVFQVPVQLDAKALALDVICTDVTKRMRTMGRQMTITDAKNILGVNPEQGRQIRNAFYAILKADNFTSKLEAGDEHWQELKHQWIQNSPFLQETVSQGGADEAAKYKAMEVLCRDVRKRLRDDYAKGVFRNDENNVKSGDGNLEDGTTTTDPGVLHENGRNATSTAARSLAMNPPHDSNDLGDLQVDPTLLQAVGDFLSLSEMPQQSPIAIYVRPHPMSEVYRSTKMWLGTLSSRTVAELHGLLSSKWPGASIMRVDGMEKGPQGQEISYLIEEDEELEAYLDHVDGRKAVFVALLNQH